MRFLVNLVVVLALALTGLTMAHASASAFDCAPFAEAGHHGAHGDQAPEDAAALEACCVAQCCMMFGGLDPARGVSGLPSVVGNVPTPFAFPSIADLHDRPPRAGFFRL